MRYRWTLPLAHAALDACLLVALVLVVDAERLNTKRPPPLWRQVHETLPEAFLREGPTPAPLKAVIAGTAPAALLASLPLPNGWRASSPFEIRWAALHLLFAALLWHAVGRTAERERRLMRASKMFLLLRVLAAPVSLSFWGNWAASLSHWLLLTFWGAAALWLLLFTARRTLRRMRTGG